MPKLSAANSAAKNPETVSFSDLILQLEDGELERDLSRAHRDLVASLGKQYQAKGGKPSTKIIVTLEFQLIDGLMHIKPSFKLDPIPERPVSRFYPTVDGALSSNPPPMQDDLPLSRKKGAA